MALERIAVRPDAYEETLIPGAVVSAVARRYGLTPQQVFTWRREARKVAEAPAFVPAVIAPAPTTEPEPVKPPRRKARRGMARQGGATIALDVDGVKVTIGNGASPATIAAVIGALKGAS